MNWSKFEWIICTIHSQRGLNAELLFSSPISKKYEFPGTYPTINTTQQAVSLKKEKWSSDEKKIFCHCNNINTFFVILATLVILGTVKKDVSWQHYMWYSCYDRKVCKQWVVKKLKLWPICKRRHINVTLRMGIEWYQKDWGLERIKSWYGTSGSRLNVKGSSDVEPVQVIKHQVSSVSILFVRKNRILC